MAVEISLTHYPIPAAIAQGLKPRSLPQFSARLKPCPYYKTDFETRFADRMSNRQYSGCDGCGWPHRAGPRSSCITTMVPYHNPIPERKQRGKAAGARAGDPAEGEVGPGMMGAWVQAEKMIQIALVLPCAGFIGWLPGFWLDRHFHQTWMAIAGVVFGIIAGLVAAVRMAVVYANDPAMDKLDENGNDADKSGKTGDSGTAS